MKVSALFFKVRHKFCADLVTCERHMLLLGQSMYVALKTVVLDGNLGRSFIGHFSQSLRLRADYSLFSEPLLDLMNKLVMQVVHLLI